MAKPTWITRSQKISTISELKYFTFQLEAANTASYSLIAGQLPPGLQLSGTGLIQGVPSISDSQILDGIYDYNFTVRATGTQTPYVIDRTFSISVSNIQVPAITSPAANLGIFEEGDRIDIQLDASDFTPDARLQWSLVANDYNFNIIATGVVIPVPQATYLTILYPGAVPGQAVVENGTNDIWLYNTNGVWTNIAHTLTNILPAGLTLSSNGRLSGYFLRSPTSDFLIYNFSVRVSDGINQSIKNFTLRVNLFALSPNPIPPLLLTDPVEMTPVKHDNFYSFKFNGYDFDDPPAQLQYFLIDSTVGFDNVGFDDGEFDPVIFDLSDTLTLDPDTGWLYGYLPTIDRTAKFTFGVGVKRVIDNATSQIKQFTLTVNEFDTIDVQWITPTDLGTVANGSISNLSVQARGAFNGRITYSLLPYNVNDPRPIRLPQGIRLTSDGLLVGRFSFRSFSLDSGATTISDGGTTTYGETYSFTVLAQEELFTTFDNLSTTWDTQATSFFDAVNTVDANTISRNYRTFTVKVVNRNPVPYENLYLKAMSSKEQRRSLNNILQAVDWLDDDYVYRAQDPYYGRAKELKMLFLPGVNVSEITDYITAVERNHYRKNIQFGEIKLAQAQDENLNVVYEIIYIQGLEDQKNSSINDALEISLFNKLTNYYTVDGFEQKYLYPNTFRNMRNRLLETLDLERRGVLPRWMTSVQRDGSIIGLTYAIPLAYVTPGYGLIAIQQLKEKIANELGTIDQLSFAVDRYNVDKQLTTFWDFDTNQFLPSEYTRFYENNVVLDIVDEVDYAVSVPFETINKANIYQLLGYSGVEIVSPQVFPVQFLEPDSPLLPAWPLWMNQNAVWFNKSLTSNLGTSPLLGSVQVMERDFEVATADTYIMSVMNTDTTEIKIDGQTVATIVGYNVTNDPANWFTTLNLTRGRHVITITMTVSNAGVNFWPDNPKGFAVTIVKGATTVFNARNSLDPKVAFNSVTYTPGLDGEFRIRSGQTLVFARQDNYPGYTGDNNGWNYINNLYGNIYEETGVGWNDSTVVPGLFDQQTDIANKKTLFTASITGTTLNVTAVYNAVNIGVDQQIFGPNVIPGTKIIGLGTGLGGVGSYVLNINQNLTSRNFYGLPVNNDGSFDIIDNQRAGIWSLDIDIQNIITLTFDQAVLPGQAVRVRSGQTYARQQLILSTSPALGRTELAYSPLTVSQNNETIFDGGDTQFIEFRELYQDPGRGDKYVIYPKLGVFE